MLILRRSSRTSDVADGESGLFAPVNDCAVGAPVNRDYDGIAVGIFLIEISGESVKTGNRSNTHGYLHGVGFSSAAESSALWSGVFKLLRASSDKFDRDASKSWTWCQICDTTWKMATNVKDLIDELKELNAKGISQAKIARMLGVTRQRVNSWFRGDVSPSFEAGLKIQELLKGRK